MTETAAAVRVVLKNLIVPVSETMTDVVNSAIVKVETEEIEKTVVEKVETVNLAVVANLAPEVAAKVLGTVSLEETAVSKNAIFAGVPDVMTVAAGLTGIATVTVITDLLQNLHRHG
jgi:hypothetical protein